MIGMQANDSYKQIQYLSPKINWPLHARSPVPLFLGLIKSVIIIISHT